jgi:hypothetical protein
MELDVSHPTAHRDFIAMSQVQRLADADGARIVDVPAGGEPEQVANGFHAQFGQFLARRATGAFQRGYRIVRGESHSGRLPRGSRHG